MAPVTLTNGQPAANSPLRRWLLRLLAVFGVTSLVALIVRTIRQHLRSLADLADDNSQKESLTNSSPKEPSAPVAPTHRHVTPGLQRKRSQYISGLKADDQPTFKAFDVFLSHKRSESQDLAARLYDRLSSDGYRVFIDRENLSELGSLCRHVRESRRLVVLLTPQIFKSYWCMAELCECVASSVEVLPIVVDGSSWEARGFPDPEQDVPKEMMLEGVSIHPRDAARVAFTHRIALEHSRTYFEAFYSRLIKSLGPPPANTAELARLFPEGSAVRAVWDAAAAAAAAATSSRTPPGSLPFSSVCEALVRVGGVRRADLELARPHLARALRAADGEADVDGAPGVSAVSLSALLGGDLALTVGALAARERASTPSASGAAGAAGAGEVTGGAAEERLVPVVVMRARAGGAKAEEGEDAGVALVGSTTSLADVRAQLTEDAEDADDAELDDDDDDPYAFVPKGAFSFLLPSRRARAAAPVQRAQEKLVRGGKVPDPVLIAPVRQRRPSTTGPGSAPAAGPGSTATLAPADAAADAADARAPAALRPSVEAAAAAAEAAAAELLKRGKRQEVEALSLDGVLRSPDLALGLRREIALVGAAAGPATRGSRADETSAVFAQRLVELRDALARGEADRVTRALATDVLAMANDGARCGGDAASVSASVAAAEDVLRSLAGAEAASREALLLPFERLKAALRSAAAGARVPASCRQRAIGERRARVVVVGGGFCGALCAKRLSTYAALHVTLVDTKEYFENTPNILRLLAADNPELERKSLIPHREWLVGGEVLIGELVAVRADHVLVGEVSGVASKVLPYDFLVLATGSTYRSDIKTEGASLEHRRASLQLERARVAAADATIIVGGGVVGTELAFEWRHAFPHKPLHWVSASDALLPRLPGAHALVQPIAEQQGMHLYLGERGLSAPPGEDIATTRGTTLPAANARVFWCTGYAPNTRYLKDARTDAALAAALDSDGFVRTRPTQQVDVPGFGRVFVGGDICEATRFGNGERMAAYAHVHAYAIVENILNAAGCRGEEGMAAPLKGAAIEPKELDGLFCTLGPGTADGHFPPQCLMTGSAEAVKPFFDAATTEGPTPWLELGGGKADGLKFGMFSDIFSGALREGELDWWDQFDGARMYNVPSAE